MAGKRGVLWCDREIHRFARNDRSDQIGTAVRNRTNDWKGARRLMTLPDTLYRAAQVRELDRLAIAGGIPADELMARAGAAALALLRTRWPRARRIGVVCGPGNNGGDGYVLARRARESGLDVAVIAVGGAVRAGAAQAARAACEARGIRIGDARAFDAGDADVIVDALLGIGLDRAVSGDARDVIEAINAAGVPVLALDVPSGLNADTGAIMGAAVRAEATIAFIGLKLGLYTGTGRAQAGEIYLDALGMPHAIYTEVAPAARRLTVERLRGLINRRRADAHKGTFGHVLVVGGAPGMAGAVRLAGEAAYRVGAGLVTVATYPDHAPMVSAARPELIAHGVRDASELMPLISRADVVALGPGLGQAPWSQALWAAALDARKPMVVDADALNLLTHEPLRRDDWVLTPHPGEAARLLGVTTAEIQADRLGAIAALHARYGGTIVLKGSGTLIGGGNVVPMELCDAGNPGMASGGMGDVLTGVIAGLAAQGLSLHDAARLGVWLHATAGDAAAAEGEIGTIASDIFPHLRKCLAHIMNAK